MMKHWNFGGLVEQKRPQNNVTVDNDKGNHPQITSLQVGELF